MQIYGLTVKQEYLTTIASIYNKGNKIQTTISSKYQVVIPKPAREHLNLKPKQKLTVIEEELRGIASDADTEGYREKKDRF